MVEECIMYVERKKDSVRFAEFKKQQREYLIRWRKENPKKYQERLKRIREKYHRNKVLVGRK